MDRASIRSSSPKCSCKWVKAASASRRSPHGTVIEGRLKQVLANHDYVGISGAIRGMSMDWPRKDAAWSWWDRAVDQLLAEPNVDADSLRMLASSVPSNAPLARLESLLQKGQGTARTEMTLGVVQGLVQGGRSDDARHLLAYLDRANGTGSQERIRQVFDFCMATASNPIPFCLRIRMLRRNSY